MTIDKAILHVLNFTSSVSIFSQKELDPSNEILVLYIQKHLKHIINDSNKKKGIFKEDSLFKEMLQKHLSSQLDFIDLSLYIANTLFKTFTNSNCLTGRDLFVVRYFEKDELYIAILFPELKDAYTHYITQDDQIISNEIIKNYSILPNTTQKIETYAIINCKDFSISFLDKPNSIDGKDCLVLPDVLLQCTSEISSKEAITAVTKTAELVAKEHGLNSVTAISRAKILLAENAELSEKISVDTIGEEIFLNLKIYKKITRKKCSN